MTKSAFSVNQVVSLAQIEAHHLQLSSISTPILLIAVTKLDGITATGLRSQGHHPKAIRAAIRLAIGGGNANGEVEPHLTSRCVAKLNMAKLLAEEEQCQQTEERHLLAAILDDNEESLTLQILQFCGVDLDALRLSLTSATPILDKLGRDLTALAKKGELDPLIGRKRELRQVVRTLVRKRKNNPVLVGPAGVGKTALVEGLANLIATGQIPVEIQNVRLVELSTAVLTAGTKYRGEFEERLLQMIDEVKRVKNIILFIDEIHTILRAGAVEGGALDAGNILKPALARGELMVIGATTLDEYRQYIAQDAALERRFQPIYVGEPSQVETLEILRGVKHSYEMHHGVIIEDDALGAAVNLSVEWIKNRQLPDKAFDLLDEACARVKIPTISQPHDKTQGITVTKTVVALVLSEWVNVDPEALLVDSG